MKDELDLAYFYMLPKVHKIPDWKTRPVVSGVSSVLEVLSKFLDVQLQRVIYLCPCYLKDSWQFLNDIKKLQNQKGYQLITADAVAMYTNINTQHAINVLSQWFDLHKQDIPAGFPLDLVARH